MSNAANPQRIVAEITRNWLWNVDRKEESKPLISKQFENIIQVNLNRGYDLESWKFAQVHGEDSITETIIAVFKAI